MSTVPADSAGATAVILVADTTVKEVAAVPPKFTAVARVKFVPVMVTALPPAVGPAVGEAEVTVGRATKVYWSAEPVADVPPGVTTVMSTVPADSAGATAVILVADTTVKEVAAVPPKLTAVARVKLVPVMVTVFPPAVGPAVGEPACTVGVATNE